MYRFDGARLGCAPGWADPLRALRAGELNRANGECLGAAVAVEEPLQHVRNSDLRISVRAFLVSVLCAVHTRISAYDS